MEGRVYRTESSQSPTWTSNTTPLSVRPEMLGMRRIYHVVRNLWITQRAIAADEIVVFTDEMPTTANLYSLLQRRRHRPTIVRTDPLLSTPRTTWRKRFLQACLANVDRLIVWAPAVADRYHRCLGLPLEKMVPLHFHHTLAGYQLPPSSEGNYLFSGGDSMRDYPTLFEAVRGLSIPVRIATHWQPPAGMSVPANVTLGPTNSAEFRTMLAGARLAVFPLLTDNLRTSGQQSYLNAMAMGKPVIVTDSEDAPYYIDDCRTGRVVPSRDVPALKKAIGQVLDSPAAARDMSEQARAFALTLDQEYTWSRVLAIAQETHRQRQR